MPRYVHQGDPSCHITDPYQKSASKQDNGKKETPPSRDTGLLCTFRASGVSNRRLRREMIKIRGIMIRARTTAIRKPQNTTTIFNIINQLVF